MSRPEFRNPVVTGGMMAAVSVAVYMLGILVPGLASLLGALPMAVCAMMIPLPAAMVSAVAAGLVIGFFLGPMTGMTFVCEFGLMGIYTGWAAAEGKRWFSIFIGGTLFAAAGMLLMLVARFAVMGFDVQAFLGTFTDMRNEMMETVRASGLLEQMANQQQSAEMLENTLSQVMQTLLELTPSLYLVVLAAITLIHLWLLKWLSGRLRMPVVYALPRIDSFSAPAWMLVPFFLAWVGILVNNNLPFYPLWLAVINVMVICAATFAAGGLSWVFRAVRWFQRPPAMRLLVLLAMLMTLQYVLIGAAAVGVVDTILQLRRTSAGG